MTSIVLADDHHVVRQGLRALLETVADLSIVGEASDGPEAIKLVAQLQPDVMVLDLMMADMNGLEVTRQVAKCSPRTCVIILSMLCNEGYVLEALRAGAKAYVLKTSTSEELLCAIREVAAGRHYLSPPLCERAIEAYIEKAKSAALDPWETLTTRQRQVLRLAAEGLSTADIAVRLGIKRRTVESHRAKVMRKLGVHTQANMIRYTLQRGILPTGDRQESQPILQRSQSPP